MARSMTRRSPSPPGWPLTATASTSPIASRTSFAPSHCRRRITVRTLCGGELFEFGDIDGVGDAVRLQHPLGVAIHAGRVFIADTYNHKIKLLDPATGKVWTLAGSGQPGHRRRSRAGGAVLRAGRRERRRGQLYVADTNNHAIRAVNARTGVVTTIEVRQSQRH